MALLLFRCSYQPEILGTPGILSNIPHNVLRSLSCGPVKKSRSSYCSCTSLENMGRKWVISRSDNHSQAHCPQREGALSFHLLNDDSIVLQTTLPRLFVGLQNYCLTVTVWVFLTASSLSSPDSLIISRSHLHPRLFVSLPRKFAVKFEFLSTISFRFFNLRLSSEDNFAFSRFPGCLRTSPVFLFFFFEFRSLTSDDERPCLELGFQSSTLAPTIQQPLRRPSPPAANPTHGTQSPNRAVARIRQMAMPSTSKAPASKNSKTEP